MKKLEGGEIIAVIFDAIRRVFATTFKGCEYCSNLHISFSLGRVYPLGENKVQSKQGSLRFLRKV